MSNDAKYYRFAMKIFADFSGTIAVPAVAGALFGQWLDQKYGTHPCYIIIFLTFALLSTGVIVWKKAKKYRNAYEAIINKENKKTD